MHVCHEEIQAVAAILPMIRDLFDYALAIGRLALARARRGTRGKR